MGKKKIHDEERQEMLRAAIDSNLGAQSSSLVAQTRAALSRFDNEPEGGHGSASKDNSPTAARSHVPLARREPGLISKPEEKDDDVALDVPPRASVRGSPSGDAVQDSATSALLHENAGDSSQDSPQRTPIRARKMSRSLTNLRFRSQSS